MTPMRNAITPPPWYDDPILVASTELMLHRAGVLPDDAAREEYRGKPWNWSRERATCLVLVAAMEAAGVPSSEGWEMTLEEIATYRGRQEHRAAMRRRTRGFLDGFVEGVTGRKVSK